MNDLNISSQYPQIEFSYETLTHKKIPYSYDICLAIPHAKKYIIWFTFHEGRNKCVLMEMNRSKNISNITVLKVSYMLSSLYLGTIIFGSLISDNDIDKNLFMVEDILMYEGLTLHKMVFGKKLKIIELFLNQQLELDGNTPPIIFYLPVFWKSHISEEQTMEIPLERISYPLHHIQYRSFDTILPYLNVIPCNDGSHVKPLISLEHRYKPLPKKKSRSEQTKYKTTFIVKADIQTDVYHLYGYDTNMKLSIYDVAYIPNCKSSVYMNSLFRNIKENYNLDLIEESDDEEDFENIDEDKNVDTKLEIVMDCVYHTQFRRWVPIKVRGAEQEVILLSLLPKL